MAVLILDLRGMVGSCFQGWFVKKKKTQKNTRLVYLHAYYSVFTQNKCLGGRCRVCAPLLCSFLHFPLYFLPSFIPGPVQLCSRCGGTVGAILTCPLEVVKTRLQSSSITLYISEVQLSTVNGAGVARVAPPGPVHCLK